jgi:hypothetical protein
VLKQTLFCVALAHFAQNLIGVATQVLGHAGCQV